MDKILVRQIPKSFIAACLIGIGLTVASSMAFGWLDGRWASPTDMTAIGDKLDELPDRVGDWVLTEDQGLGDDAQQILRCYGETVRVYTNIVSGSRVTVAVLLGPRGPIAVHTPEICYSGQGVRPAGQPKPVEITSGTEKHTLWQNEFLSKVDGQPELEVFYGWSDGGPWQAAEQPRYWLTDRLYKIQLAGPPVLDGQPSENQQFLELFLAQLQPLLVPSARHSSAELVPRLSPP